MVEGSKGGGDEGEEDGVGDAELKVFDTMVETNSDR
jgi:hypothetical protein